MALPSALECISVIPPGGLRQPQQRLAQHSSAAVQVHVRNATAAAVAPHNASVAQNASHSGLVSSVGVSPPPANVTSHSKAQATPARVAHFAVANSTHAADSTHLANATHRNTSIHVATNSTHAATQASPRSHLKITMNSTKVASPRSLVGAVAVRHSVRTNSTNKTKAQSIVVQPQHVGPQHHPWSRASAISNVAHEKPTPEPKKVKKEPVDLDTFLVACVAHVKKMVTALDRSYTDVQLESALLSYCETSEAFPMAESLDDGFHTLDHCKEFSGKLVMARDEARAGNKTSYRDFCSAYYKRRTTVEEPEEKPTLKPPEKPHEIPSYRATSWLVSASLLAGLMISAFLVCLSAACAASSA